LTQDEQETHRVISNDIVSLAKNRRNNTFIQGDFTHEPVQTQIAMEMEDKNFDVVLCDISPEYTGNVNLDAR
jgi:23S rRNA U2552 (ribose-2'-O)-methylase RlmE/FtsJ